MAKRFSRTTSKRKTTRSKRNVGKKMTKRSPYNSTWNYMKCSHESKVEH